MRLSIKRFQNHCHRSVNFFCTAQVIPEWANVLTFRPRYPKWGQNLRVTPLSKTTSIFVTYIPESSPPPPPGIMSLFRSIWFRNFEAGVQAGACAGATVKVHEEFGNLELGKIHKVYVQDPGLRDILKLIELDSDRAKDIQGHKLRLITSVVYSERLKLRGKRFTEVMKNRWLFTCLSTLPYTAQWQRPLDCAQSAKITSPLRTSKSEANRCIRTPLYLFFWTAGFCCIDTFWWR